MAITVAVERICMSTRTCPENVCCWDSKTSMGSALWHRLSMAHGDIALWGHPFWESLFLINGTQTYWFSSPLAIIFTLMFLGLSYEQWWIHINISKNSTEPCQLAVVLWAGAKYHTKATGWFVVFIKWYSHLFVEHIFSSVCLVVFPFGSRGTYFESLFLMVAAHVCWLRRHVASFVKIDYPLAPSVGESSCSPLTKYLDPPSYPTIWTEKY